ncbi:hypothetical protein K439DRAFT_1619673 [Ramaria rubella]|nr:hypothetical protein K439DRAFT_1619673 [Ramaria rubella]
MVWRGMAVGGDGGRLEVNGGGAARIRWQQGAAQMGMAARMWWVAAGTTVGDGGVVAGGKRAAAVRVLTVRRGGGWQGGGDGVRVRLRWQRGWRVGPRGWGWRRMRWVVAGTAVEDGVGDVSEVWWRVAAVASADVVAGGVVATGALWWQRGGGGAGGVATSAAPAEGWWWWWWWGVGDICDVVCDHSALLAPQSDDSFQMTVKLVVSAFMGHLQH